MLVIVSGSTALRRYVIFSLASALKEPVDDDIWALACSLGNR